MAIYGDLLPLSQGIKDWRGMTVANGNVYACVSAGDIYMQTGGSGNFNPLSQTTREWYSMTTLGNHVYCAVRNGKIYRQENGVGNFTLWPAVQANNREWYGMTSLNGDVYACAHVEGNIYKQTGGVGDFVLIEDNIAQWSGMAAANGNVYACAQNVAADIYMQTGAAGAFNALHQTSGLWRGLAADDNDVYAAIFNDDIYKQTDGVGNFEPLGYDARPWRGMAFLPGYFYASDENGDIYRATAIAIPVIIDITSSIVTYSGTTITITGTDLTGSGATIVTIGGIDYTAYILTSNATTITMVAPNLVDGTYGVIVSLDGRPSNSYNITYLSGRTVSMSTYAFDVQITNSVGVASTGLTLTALNVLGGVSPYSLTEKGNGWYSHLAMPQGEYVIYKDVNGSPVSTGIYVTHTPGISEEVGGYKNILDQKIKNEYKSVYNFGPQGTYFNAASVSACVARAVAEGIKKVIVPPGIYLLESAVTLANDDIALIGYGNVTFKYPTGITTANWSLLKLGGANIKVKGITFDCAGMDNSNTTLGAIHTYQAGAVNCKLEDCLIKTRVGGPAVHLEYGSAFKIDSCKFTGNTYDIKSRVANFNYLHLINCEFTSGSQILDIDSGLIITSVGGKSLGSITPYLTFAKQMIGVYFDGTNYRKIPGTTFSWLIWDDSGTLVYQYRDISALASHAIVTFPTTTLSISDSTGRVNANSFSPSYGITFDTGSTFYRSKTFQIGDWNMDSLATVTIDISSIKGTASKYHEIIKSIDAVIKSDSEGTLASLFHMGDGGAHITESNGILTLERATAGYFDSSAFDSTSFNRGWVTITYLYT